MSMRTRRFSAPWSALTWFMTLLVILVAVIATCAVLAKTEKIASDNPTARERLTVAALIVPLILMVALAFAPLGYTVDEVGIVVSRMGPNIYILHSRIVEIRRLTRRDVGFSIRLGGSGGVFGLFGRLWSTRLGRHRAYVTNTKDLVLIRCDNGVKVLLSPYPADAFVEALAQARAISGEK